MHISAVRVQYVLSHYLPQALPVRGTARSSPLNFKSALPERPKRLDHGTGSDLREWGKQGSCKLSRNCPEWTWLYKLHLGKGVQGVLCLVFCCTFS